MEQKALEIIKVLRNANFQAVFAGGFVRDKILGISSSDIDIATNATPDEIESLFQKTIPVGKSFGVIIVVIDETEFEVATFRNDGVYKDGRRPESVSFSSIEEDAKRRDLTINGMFFDPIDNKIIDFVGGQEDLKNKVIRMIGDSEERIAEDKLRMLRVIRFATRFNFEIEKATLDSVKKHAKEIAQVSSERIFDETKKILRTRNFRRAINLLFETDLISYILPEIKAMDGVEQPPQFHPEGTVIEHTILILEKLPKDASDELLFGALFHDVGKPKTFTVSDRIRFNAHDIVGAGITKNILRRMKCSNTFSERVVSLVENHMRFMAVRKMKISKLKRFLRIPDFNEHLILHKADCEASHGELENYDFVSKIDFPPDEVKPIRLINGNDLLELGFVPGPIFKKILEAVEDEQLEKRVNNREEALAFVSENYERERHNE